MVDDWKTQIEEKYGGANNPAKDSGFENKPKRKREKPKKLGIRNIIADRYNVIKDENGNIVDKELVQHEGETEMRDLMNEIRDTLEKNNRSEYANQSQDPYKFYPSQVGMCKRQMFLSKLDQHYYPHQTQAKFVTGTMIHKWLEENLEPHFEEEGDNQIEMEKWIDFTEDGLRFKGRADYYNPESGRVVDFKTRGAWYNFEPPKMKHLQQVMTYMRGLDDADKGTLVYLRKRDLDFRTWPSRKDGKRFFRFSDDVWSKTKEKCRAVGDAVDERMNNREPDDYVRSLEDIPFKRCGDEDCMCSDEDEDATDTYMFMLDEGAIYQ